jgi:hypothetical protein
MNFIDQLKQALLGQYKQSADYDPWQDTDFGRSPDDYNRVPVPKYQGEQKQAHIGPEKTPDTTKPIKDWTQPDHRIELPRDFPLPLGHGSSIASIADVIDKELKKNGTSLDQVDRIHVVFPHKHPGLFPGHFDNAQRYASDFVHKMKNSGGVAGKIIWGMANELVETKKLGRSEDQSSVHALTAKQEYVFFNPQATQASPLATMGDNRKEFFVVVDAMSEQGTTFANLINHIRHNGGVVVATVGANRLLQETSDTYLQRQAHLPSKFMDPNRNTGRLPELALALSGSAKRSGHDWTPEQCLEKFEAALQKNGNSVYAMTNGEVGRVIASVSGMHDTSETFLRMINRLESRGQGKGDPLMVKASQLINKALRPG